MLPLVGVDPGELDQVVVLLGHVGDRAVLVRVDRVVHDGPPLHPGDGRLLGMTDGDQVDLARDRAEEVPLGLGERPMQRGRDRRLQPGLRGDQDAHEARVVVDDVERTPAHRLVAAIEKEVVAGNAVLVAQVFLPAFGG